MIYIIIPCHNESVFLLDIVKEALASSADRIILVDNGSTDDTLEVIKNLSSDKIEVLYWNLPLGYDVPRAAGLHYALLEGGEYFVFLDGDMKGIKSPDIEKLIDSLKGGVDLSLTDCYFEGDLPQGLGHFVIEFREILNRELKLFDKIKYSTPSHGPHGISRRLALSTPLRHVAVPPMLLLWAAKFGFRVEVGLEKLHRDIGSLERDEKHALKMAETIIGDCVSVINFLKEGKPIRRYDGIEYTGYHYERRLDLLDIIIKDAAQGL